MKDKSKCTVGEKLQCFCVFIENDYDAYRIMKGIKLLI
jgi:hypothetical protein